MSDFNMTSHFVQVTQQKWKHIRLVSFKLLEYHFGWKRLKESLINIQICILQIKSIDGGFLKLISMFLNTSTLSLGR